MSSYDPFAPPPKEPRRPSRVGAAVRQGLPLLAAGVLGAGVAIGVAAAVGIGDTTSTTTTVVRDGGAAATEASRSTASFASSGDSLSVQEIYERSAPGVVQITAARQATDPLGQSGEARSFGSGFVLDKAGHIVTNFHVVDGAQEVQVSFSNGDRVAARVLGSDASTDIAVLQVDLPASALTPIPLGDSDAVEVGDPVVAIGNPFGLERTVTAGIVSAIQREIVAPNGYPIDHVIQTDAQINQGNSGGPLLNSAGAVIGVNSQIETGGTGSGNVGIGFAVPVNTLKDVAAQLIESGKVERAFLGIEMQTINPDAARELRLPVEEGVLVATVRPGSPAEGAGMQGGDTSSVVNGETWVLGGDVIVEADGQAITDADQLRQIVLGMKPGDSLTLEIIRDGEPMTLTIELGRQPTTPTG